MVIKIYDEAPERYTVTVAAQAVGFIEYYRFDWIAIVTHTEILAGSHGRGLGSRVACCALEFFRSEGKQVVPVCGFFAQYIRSNPEHADLVSPAARQVFHI